MTMSAQKPLLGIRVVELAGLAPGFSFQFSTELIYLPSSFCSLWNY